MVDAKNSTNTYVRDIFCKMEYGLVFEDISQSMAWLKSRESICATVNNGKENSQGEAITVKDANTGQPLITVYNPKPEDIDKIICDSINDHQWSKLSAHERSVLMDKLAQEIEKNSKLFCQLEISVRGILSNDVTFKTLPLLIDYLHYYASWAAKSKTKDNNEAITCSVICDDAFLAVFGLVLGPALAAGYKIILQTESKISVVAALIIKLAEDVGIPQGIIKLLPGKVDLNSSILKRRIDIISCFGSLYEKQFRHLLRSTETKLLALTNTKNPMIIFNNADLDSATDSVIDAAWGHQGILPWSIGTVIVQEDVFTTFVDKLKYRLNKIKIGSATDKMADISYPVSDKQIDEFQIIVDTARSLGAEVYKTNKYDHGILEPTLLIGGGAFENNVIKEDNNLPIVRIIAFRTCNEAASLATNSRYGFAASVWTENIDLANEIARKLTIGIVWINSYGNFIPQVSVMPYKQSGTGYFGGVEGFMEYYEHNRKIIDDDLKKMNLPSKKSESKDLHIVISKAKKAQLVWSKLTILDRSKLLRKVAFELYHNKEHLKNNMGINVEIIDDWVSLTYRALAEVSNLGNTAIENVYVVKSYREPVGVLAIEGHNSNLAVIASILLGNSVIILNTIPNHKLFYLEVCKYFSVCNTPSNIFNVISNCKEGIYEEIMLNRELDVCILNNCNDTFQSTKSEYLQHCYMHTESWSEIIKCVTRLKTVWFNVGHSVL